MPLDRSRSRTWPQASSSTPGPSTYLQSQSVAEQLALVDQQLKERTAEIQLVKERLKEASAALTELEEARSKLLETRQTLTAPIMKLPYELLAHIFELGNERDEEPDWVEKVPDDEEEDEMAFPMAVSQVNRRFREVAITTSSLWQNITMNDPPHYNLSRLWLSRARLIDVDLDLTGSGMLAWSDMRYMLSHLMPPSRWRTFTLQTEDYYHIHTALTMMEEPASELLELELVNAHSEFDEDEDVPTSDPVDIFGGIAPKLQSLSLYSVPVRWSAPMLSGLKVLELEYLPIAWRPSWDEWVTLMRACPELEHLTLMASGPHIPEQSDPRYYPTIEPIKLEKLEHLELGDMRPWVLSHVVNTLQTPNLTDLSLDTLHEYDCTEQIRLVSDARYPLLRRLKIVLVHLEASEFLALLRRLPLLEQLELNALDSFLSTIMDDDRDPERTGPLVVPKLHTLWATGYSGHELAAFVEQRKRLGGAVRTVLIPYRDERLVSGGHLSYLQRETEFGYFEGSDREQGDEDEDEEDEDEEVGSDWGEEMELDEEMYEDQEDWFDEADAGEDVGAEMTEDAMEEFWGAAIG